MDCSGSMAVDAGGTAVGGWGACAWIWLAGAGGVVVRGGVLERLLRGVPPMGDGNVGGVWGCSGKVTGGVGMRLTYCHRSCGCLLVADVGLGDAVGSVLLAAGGEVAD